jgi:hypothetical protein
VRGAINKRGEYPATTAMIKFLNKITPTYLVLTLLLFGSVMPFAVANAQQAGECWLGERNLGLDYKSCRDEMALNDAIKWKPAASTGTKTNTQNQQDETKLADVVNSTSWWDNIKCTATPIDCGFRNFFATISHLILKIVSFLTMLGGLILNGAIFHTVVNTTENYKNLPAINEAWKVIRDVANMAFIFVLLYAAINTMIGRGRDTQGLIVKIIVVAVLINFSLFFTKFIIDIANLLSLTFYDAMVPRAAGQGLKVVFTGDGLSNAFMDAMNLQRLYSMNGTSPITFFGMITTSVMGSIMLLVAAFVFFTVGILFIMRYVILIMLLILSPIAFIAFILPEAKKYQDQWMNALIGQAFFAPIYMMLTWVSLKIIEGINSSQVLTITSQGTGTNLTGITNPSTSVMANAGSALGVFPMFINYMVAIAFLIFSLVVAKDFAGRVPGGFGKAMSWASGVAGGATFGLAARGSRFVAGGVAEKIADSRFYKSLETKSADRGVAGFFARTSLAGVDKTRRASFDVRGSSVMGGVLEGAGMGAGKAKEGGFEADRKAFNEFLASPGTEAYKKRNERARTAKTELNIADNLRHAAPLDELNRLDATLKSLDDEEKKIREDIRKGTATTAQKLRLTDIPNDRAKANDQKKDLEPRRKELEEQVGSLEKTINDASTKEIEAIVKSNRDLLKSQEFANRISVQQLEAITKSDNFTEEEKGMLKKNRFAAFDKDASGPSGVNGLAALAKDEKIRTPEENVAAKAASSAIRGLRDSELEMVDPSLFSNTAFVANLKAAQIETINKSNKFTASQRKALGDVRKQPLVEALSRGDKDKIEKLLKSLGHKEIAGLELDQLQHASLMPLLTVQMLKRIGPEMSPDNVSTLRTTLADPESPSTKKVKDWLEKDENNFS